MRLLKSFGYALSGLKIAFIEERNLKIHLITFLAVCLAGFYFSITSIEWCIILLAAGSVIGLELINTAVENLSDLVTKERSPLVKKVKDITAGAVFIVSIMAVIIGMIIFVNYFKGF